MKSMMLKLMLHAMVGILLLGCAQILTACTNGPDGTTPDDTTPDEDPKNRSFRKAAVRHRAFGDDR